MYILSQHKIKNAGLYPRCKRLSVPDCVVVSGINAHIHLYPVTHKFYNLDAKRKVLINKLGIKIHNGTPLEFETKINKNFQKYLNINRITIPKSEYVGTSNTYYRTWNRILNQIVGCIDEYLELGPVEAQVSNHLKNLNHSILLVGSNETCYRVLNYYTDSNKINKWIDKKEIALGVSLHPVFYSVFPSLNYYRKSGGN